MLSTELFVSLSHFSHSHTIGKASIIYFIWEMKTDLQIYKVWATLLYTTYPLSVSDEV